MKSSGVALLTVSSRHWAERMVATFESEKREVRYEVIANSVINPFLMKSLTEFRCPPRF